MNLDEQDRAFVEGARAWLLANVPAEPLPAAYTPEGMEAHRGWERRLLDAGYGAMSWPKQYGGGAASIVREYLFVGEYIRASGPDRINRMGLGLVGPTIIAFGTNRQKERWLAPILDCSELWCQGFSEPGAGSDLASVATRADRAGDDYIVTGQKVWTSFAIYADWICALVRTDASSRRHEGLTFLLIPMKSPGIEIRPLRQLHGEPGFGEVFFTDVRVPVTNALGAEGDGWRVAMTMLGFERAAAVGHPARFLRDVADLVELAKSVGLDQDPVVRDAVAARFAEARAFENAIEESVARVARGEAVGAAASVTKLYWSEMEARIYETVLDVLGPLAETADAGIGTRAGRAIMRRYWHARASRIYAGTSEIQRNIVSERILGLPREAVNER